MGVGVEQKQKVRVPKGSVPQWPLALPRLPAGHPGLCLALNKGSIIVTHHPCCRCSFLEKPLVASQESDQEPACSLASPADRVRNLEVVLSS